jgi:hypothetical protein
MAGKTKEQKRLEDIAKLEDKKAFKYKKASDLMIDLNTRLKIALQDGRDPLGELSITQIVQDIETVDRLKGLNIEE